MSVSERMYRRSYPDTSRSGTLFFYGWMRRELTPPYRTLNLGARPGHGRPRTLSHISPHEHAESIAAACEKGGLQRSGVGYV
jgi:hypothetical protein